MLCFSRSSFYLFRLVSFLSVACYLLRKYIYTFGINIYFFFFRRHCICLCRRIKKNIYRLSFLRHLLEKWNKRKMLYFNYDTPTIPTPPRLIITYKRSSNAFAQWNKIIICEEGVILFFVFVTVRETHMKLMVNRFLLSLLLLCVLLTF